MIRFCEDLDHCDPRAVGECVATVDGDTIEGEYSKDKITGEVSVCLECKSIPEGCTVSLQLKDHDGSPTSDYKGRIKDGLLV